jgi:hypothetical protein
VIDEPAPTAPPLVAPAPAEPAPTEPALAEPAPAEPVRPPIPPVASTRSLLARSFELLAHANEDMRRASFYIGAVVLGMAGPFALTAWGLEIATFHRSELAAEAAYLDAEPFLVVLALLAAAGVAVAAVESRTLAAAVLGGRLAGRPATIRQALARSRTSFWGAVAASIIVALPVSLAQGLLGGILLPADAPDELIAAVSTLIAAIVGAPFAYVLAGIVLGGVDPIESTRRSFRVFGARRLAAVLVAAIDSFAVLLLVFGLGQGLDIAIRVAGALGLGAGSDPAGLALATAGIVAVLFALGTLLFTVYAIAIAPQVVMFVGLTHATFGLDRVRNGGPDDPDVVRPGRARFRWFTRLMFAGFALGAVLAAVALARVAA